MRGNLLLVMLITTTSLLFAQEAASEKKSNVGDAKWSLGVNIDALDLFSPKLDKYVPFNRGLDFGPKFTLWYNPNPSLAVDMHIGTQAFREYVKDDPVNNLHLLQTGVGLNYKLNNGYILKETTPIAPYIFAHGNVMYFESSETGEEKFGFGMPVGLGFNIKLGHDIALNLHGGYSFGLTTQTEDYIFYSGGFMFDLDGNAHKKTKPEPKVVEKVIPQPIDSDNDGVTDENDDCPNVAGLATLGGCPDADGDGIKDGDDDCPNVAGIARFKGCPDTDGDGIEDENDKCPNKKGLARLNGCPLSDIDEDGIEDEKDQCPSIPGVRRLNGCPDADGDGITDSEDRCPTQPGPAANKGCPEVKEEVKKKLEWAAQNIQFETGSAIIKTSSFSVLNEVAKILGEFPEYSVQVEGHTDNVGSDAINLSLSNKRAAAAAAYLINKGVSSKRVSSIGYGETRPIADNNTAKGRALNRRVNFKLYIP